MQLNTFLEQHKPPAIMGILNVTPDSFSDGGRFATLDRALKRAEQLICEGADVLDVGGESSRPGAKAVGEAEERQRVVPVIYAIRKRFDITISIDTVKASVAQAALEAGANWINDISAMSDDPQMAALAARAGVPVVLMHRQGTPQNDYQDFAYEELIEDVMAYFSERIEFALASGISRDQLVLDPGVGFGKKAIHNCQLLDRLAEFKVFGLPLLVGTSRKSFIGKLMGVSMDDRLPSTIASNVLATLNGADIVRVHDVAEVRQALMMTRHIQSSR